MLEVHIKYHKDGDLLVIVESPAWLKIYEFLLHRIEPCCGVMGYLSRFDWIGAPIYSLTNRLVRVIFKYQRELFEVPIRSGCEASIALWPKDTICWQDDCEYHPWEDSDDAYNSTEGRRHVIVNWMVQFAERCKLTCLKLIRLSRGKSSFDKTHR